MRKTLLEMSLDLGKCPNYKTHESEHTIFFLMSEIISESGFLIKSYINIVQKIIVERFGPYLRKKFKGGFPIEFSKMALADV